MATARSQSRKAQSQRDKKANHRKQKATSASGVQCHQISVVTNLKEQERDADRVTAGTIMKTFFKMKRHRLEPEQHDPKDQERQGSLERKWRGVVSSTSSISSDCAFLAFSHATVAFLVPGVQHINSKSKTSVDFVDGSPIPVLTAVKYTPAPAAWRSFYAQKGVYTPEGSTVC